MTIRSYRSINVPEIMAKSASTTAQIPWLIIFHDTSASFFWVVTEMSRMTEAIQTLDNRVSLCGDDAN